MERLEFKSAFTVSDAGEITGLAWPFGSPDMVGDEILPGAFKGASAPMPMLFGHDQRETVGVWDSFTETDKGLEVRGRLLINEVARAAEVRALVREKAATGLSIGFGTKKAVARKGGGRTISEVNLMEISIVAIPCHPGARITSAKAAQAGKEGTTVSDQQQEAAQQLAAIETKMGAMETSLKSVEKLNERLDGIEAKMNRPDGTTDKEEGSIEKKALNNFLRNGVASLNEEDQKTLNLGTPAAGGYVTAPEYSTTVIEKVTEFSPMRSLASIMSIGTTEIYLPTLETPLTGNWVTETGPRPSSEPVFDQLNIKVFEHAVTVPVSQQLIEDSFIDLQSYLAGQIGQQFGKAEAAAFVTGDGNGKPTGFLNDPAVFEQVTAAQDGTDVIDQLIKLFYALPSAYAARASWLMNRKTMALIRGSLDTTKRMLWGDSLATGQPATLLGRPVYEAVDMPDYQPEVAADTFPVAFGDFSAGYQIVDRVGVQIMRDDYTGADNGIVKIRARRRVGGKTVQPEAIALLKSDAA